MTSAPMSPLPPPSRGSSVTRTAGEAPLWRGRGEGRGVGVGLGGLGGLGGGSVCLPEASAMACFSICLRCFVMFPCWFFKGNLSLLDIFCFSQGA